MAISKTRLIQAQTLAKVSPAFKNFLRGLSSDSAKSAYTRYNFDFMKFHGLNTVVPDPPIRSSGIASRRPYRKLYNDWFNGFMEEITWYMVLYRIEWKSQNEGEEMGGYQDKGDGS